MLLFQAVCFDQNLSSFPSSFFFSTSSPRCSFSDFYFPERRSHQWFLLFGVNIPNVSLFVYCISALTERFSQGRVKHAPMGIHNTDHNTRLEREMLKPNTFILLCLSRSFSFKGFCFKLYDVGKNMNNKPWSHLINCIHIKIVVYKKIRL